MMPHHRFRPSARRRLRLQVGCAAAAIVAIGGAGTSPAFGQAFNGTPTVVAGQANFDRTTPGVETITVLDDAIVDWVPVEPTVGNIDFLPAGNTATFQDGPGGGGFAILNRILPVGTGVVELNGTVVSQLQTNSGLVRGGTVAFYSPTGLLIGGGALFDVGSLILSAADLDAGSFQDFGSGNGALSLTAAAGSQASVEVAPGAVINATAENSFVAMVAPQVVMNGNVRVNGSTAYVAAEAVSLALMDGLFDIIVTTGSSVAGTIIEHGGNTGGPARTGTDGNQMIYAVGVGQAQAVQLVFGGNLGFDPATSASVVNGEIILSAGYDVEGRDFPDAFRGAGYNDGDASVILAADDFSSSVTGIATTDFSVGAGPSGSTNFASDLSITGFSSASVFAGAGETVTIEGSVSVSAADLKNFSVANLAVTAQLDAQGGTARISSGDGGSVAIAGDAIVNAGASAANDGVRNLSGDAIGGTAEIFASTGGQVTVGGAMIVTADGRGSSSFGGGGTGTGGTAIVGVNGGNLLGLGEVTVTATGQGGAGIGGIPGSDPGAGGGASGGGLVQIYARAGNVTIGDARVDASASGGDGAQGGSAQAGNAGILSQGAEIIINGDIVATADAYGGDASEGFGGQGGAAVGGTAYVQAESPAGAQLIGGAATVTANAVGGVGGAGNGGSIAPGAGGEARAGLFDGQINTGGAFVLAGREQATVSLTDLRVEAIGTGGSGGAAGTGQMGGAGGDGYGGTAQVGGFTGGATSSLLGSVMQFAAAGISASAFGGAGGVGTAVGSPADGVGGAAEGGFAVVTGTSGGLATGTRADLSSNATGGQGRTGGSATGGFAGFSTVGDIELPTVEVQARALAGTGADGNLGTATGGGLVVETFAGQFQSTGTVLVGALNSDITTQGNSATTAPGRLIMTVTAGEAIFNSFQVSASEDVPGALAGDASVISTGGLISFLDAAFVQVNGDLSISTTGPGQILGGPDQNTPTGTLSFAAANGTISIEGVNDDAINLGAQSLTLASNDLEIGEGARIGAVELSLIAPDDGQNVTLGGSDQGPGYTLTQAEAERIEAGSVYFSGGDVVVRDLTITGTPDDGPSYVELSANNVSVQGALVYLAGPGDTLAIDAVGDEGNGILEVITPTGSISVNDGETLSGRLEIEAGTVIVADAELAERIRADPNFDGLSEALASNNGPDNPEGYLQAAAIAFVFDGEPGEPQKGIFIQNSGNDSLFGGIATRTGGLSFALEDDDDEAATVRILAHGAGLDDSGNVVTGPAYFATVDFDAEPGITFTDDSEFNGFFVNTGLPVRPGIDQLEGGAIIGAEIIDGPLTQVVTPEPSEEERDVAFGGAFPGLINTADLTLDSMIDQAVASGGDSAQWRSRGEDDDEDDQDGANGDGQEP